MASKSTLRKSDFKSDTWDRVKQTITDRIAELQSQLESFNLTLETTAATRGRLAELRKLLALERQPAEVPRSGDILSGVRSIVAESPGFDEPAFPD